MPVREVGGRGRWKQEGEGEEKRGKKKVILNELDVILLTVIFLTKSNRCTSLDARLTT